MRKESEIMREIFGVYVELEPENLEWDGERPEPEVGRARKDLNRQLRSLFVELGREVSEEEAWAWMEANAEGGAR